MNSCISHVEFVSVNNVLREYYEMKEEIKILKLLWNMLNKINGNLLSKVSAVKNILLTKIQLSEKLNKIAFIKLCCLWQEENNYHLKLPGFTYSACGPFTKHCKRIQKFREAGNLKHFYRNKLNKACFAHDAACSVNKDLDKKAISDKILKDRAYEFAGNCRYDIYQEA